MCRKCSSLRLVNYGGKVSLEVEYEDSGGALEAKRVQGELLLRTKKALILSSVEGRKEYETIEIALEHIRRISYMCPKATSNNGGMQMLRTE